MAPIAANGLVYVGNAGGDQVNVTGHVYALDANDGHVVWKFDVVPETGPARATWTNPKYPLSGGAFWTSFTLDEPNGVLYVPAGNPAPDFDSELRTGDNLYTDSVIAIDAATGRMLGYNRLVKRDSHDWDVDSPPMLATTRSGKRIIASANKDGLLSILDRSRVTRGAAPADLMAVLPLLSQTPTTTRENVDMPLSRDHAVRFCPGIQGGVEWNGAGFSPENNSLFVAAVDWCAHPMLAGVTPTAGGLVFAAHLGGQIYAVDADTGSILWQSSTGQSTGGGIVTYRAGGRQLLGVASEMKSPMWPGGAQQSRILVYGLR
jgi:alcohol dehydrogenase (cytochrome c)